MSRVNKYKRIARLHNNILRSRYFVLFAILALGGITIRAVLPSAVQWYVNQELDKSPQYEGSIGDVDLQLYKGSYRIENVTISKISGNVPVPLFKAEQFNFSILWSALLQGKIVSEVTFESARINIVDGEDRVDDQTGQNNNWIQLLDNLAPIRIDKLTIVDSSLHFLNFEAENQVDVSISDLDATILDLTNSRFATGDETATLQGKGTFADTGRIEFNSHFNPNRESPTFNLDLRLQDLSLLSIENLISTYTPVDIESGNMSLTIELAAENGNVEGYVKPLITNLTIFDWDQDVLEDSDNPLKLLRESLIGLSSELLENQPMDQLGSIIPVSGKLAEPETHNWQAFINMLKNAFVEAFNEKFENTVSLEQLSLEDEA